MTGTGGVHRKDVLPLQGRNQSPGYSHLGSRQYGRAAVGLSNGEGSARSLTDRAMSLKLAPPNILLAIRPLLVLTPHSFKYR